MKAIIAVVALVVIGVIALFAFSSGPSVKVDPSVKVIGLSTPI